MAGGIIKSEWVEAIASTLLVLTLPIAVAIQMEVGGMLGVPSTDPDPGLDGWVRFAVWAASFLAPFVIGTLLGADALRRRPAPAARLVAWIGVLGNLGVIAMALMFVLGEVANPH